MALDFGKLAFSVSLDPTSAFPLDSRSYFESYESAKAAAQTAQSAGSKDSVYYYGQTLAVVENGLASFYIIQPDGSLSSIAGDPIQINEKQFIFDENGQLNLAGFIDADNGSVLSVDKGSISWINLTDNYYTKAEINNKLIDVDHLKRKVLAEGETVESYLGKPDAERYIYMVPTGFLDEPNKYNEYLILTIEDTEGVSQQIIEPVGTWEIDLEEYVKKNELDEYLKKEDATSFENYISDVDETNFSVENKKLYLKNLEISKINGLANLLVSKYDRSEGFLLTQAEKDLLNSLVEQEEISPEDIVGFEEWLKKWIKDQVDAEEPLYGLSQANYTFNEKLKLKNLENIQSIDTSDFTLSTEGKLSINKVNVNKVEGLEDLLNTKVTEKVNIAQSSLETYLNNKMITVNKRIDDLDNRLTWQPLIESEG